MRWEDAIAMALDGRIEDAKSIARALDLRSDQEAVM